MLLASIVIVDGILISMGAVQLVCMCEWVFECGEGGGGCFGCFWIPSRGLSVCVTEAHGGGRPKIIFAGL